ncbi:hypothetical protein Tco_0910142 [Tanacetum coccineum]|uniref:Uncharacterized protein n=1 Tax=Tanacetum coccineum TaxID=301880 RepID=A0ABQ5CUT2_9ASTR
MEDEQMDAPVMDMEEDLAALFGDDDFKDDASDGFDEEEYGRGLSTAATKGPSFPHSVSGLTVPPSVIEDLKVAAGVTIREIGQRVFAIEGQADVQQRDTQIQQLQTTVTEMGSRESTLMRCILGLEKRIAALERRPLGPQWVEAEMVSHEVEREKWRNEVEMYEIEKILSYIECMCLCLSSDVVKMTSFTRPGMSSGSIVVKYN